MSMNGQDTARRPVREPAPTLKSDMERTGNSLTEVMVDYIHTGIERKAPERIGNCWTTLDSMMRTALDMNDDAERGEVRAASAYLGWNY